MAKWQYQSKVEVLITEGEQIFLDKWFVRSSEPVRDVKRWQYLYPDKFFFETPMDVVVPMDKWFQPASEPVRIKQDWRWVYPTWIADAQLFNVPGVIYDPATLSFKPAYQDIVWGRPEKRWQYPYVSFVGQIGCQPLWGPAHVSAEIIFLLPDGRLAKRLTDIIYLEM